MIPVLVCGAAGRMGGHVLRAVAASTSLRVAAALEHEGHALVGEEIHPGIKLGDSVEDALQGVQLAIDFSLPEGTLRLTEAAARRGVALVIGTTGLSAEQRGRIEAAARGIPILLAPNFSLGVNVLLELVAEAARRLEGYEIEILELHHSRKLDAPSGTALALARAAAGARGLELDAHAVYHREGHTGPRPPEAIGLQSLRAGDSIGEHSVYLAGPGERLELSHRALSRDSFAAGAVRAASWLAGRPPGLYSMQDCLG
ncbi:MAG: 4-hydroxy-tetrahydrodipicolinate reductase [Myxococcota bacterium]